DRAVESIARRWQADRGRIQTDLENFIAELRQRGLLVTAEQSPRRRGTLPAQLILAGLVRLTLLRPTFAGKAPGLLSLAKLSCRWLGWARAVRLWQRLFPRPRRLREGTAADEARQTVDRAVRDALARSVVATACKERGLVSWALARRAGLAPRLT